MTTEAQQFQQQQQQASAGRKFNITVNNYDGTKAGFINVMPNCNSVLVTNIGDTTAFINGKVLFPSTTPTTDAGDSIAFGGNEGDIYSGNLQLKFSIPLGASPQVEILQLYYI